MCLKILAKTDNNGTIILKLVSKIPVHIFNPLYTVILIGRIISYSVLFVSAPLISNFYTPCNVTDDKDRSVNYIGLCTDFTCIKFTSN